MPELENEILIYNFKTIDVEKINLEKISDDNPLKLVFKMAKTLLETNSKDEEIYETKIKLAEELVRYDKVKNNEQIKALVDFLEYLFLIQDSELEKRYETYKKEKGVALRMTVDQIRKLHYKQEGREEGREEGIEKEKEKSRLKDVERVIKLLTRKSGVLDNSFIEKIEKLNSDKLNLIIENILDIENLEEVEKYFNQ